MTAHPIMQRIVAQTNISSALRSHYGRRRSIPDGRFLFAPFEDNAARVVLYEDEKGRGIAVYFCVREVFMLRPMRVLPNASGSGERNINNRVRKL